MIKIQISLLVYQIQTETNVHEQYLLHIPILYKVLGTDTEILYKNYISISDGLKMEMVQFHFKNFDFKTDSWSTQGYICLLC